MTSECSCGRLVVCGDSSVAIVIYLSFELTIKWLCILLINLFNLCTLWAENLRFGLWRGRAITSRDECRLTSEKREWENYVDVFVRWFRLKNMRD